jgi:NADH-quinone oxidoreductase subunit A
MQEYQDCVNRIRPRNTFEEDMLRMAERRTAAAEAKALEAAAEAKALEAAAEAKALEAAAEAKALEAAAEAPAPAAETVEAAKTAVEIAAPKGLLYNPEYRAIMKEFEDCLLHGINPSRERTTELFDKLSRLWLEAQAVETPAQAAETPAQAVETPVEVVEVAKTAVESAAAGQPQDPGTMSCPELFSWYSDLLKGSEEPFRGQMKWYKKLTECYERWGATPKTPAEAPAEAANLAETAVETSAAAVEAPASAAAPAETPAEVVEVAKTAVESAEAATPEAAEVLEQWCHRTEVSGHELPPGTGGPALESMAEIYQVYGFELGSLLLISLGILVQLLQLVLVGLMKLLGNNPRYPTEERVPSSGYECGFSPFAAISSSSLVVFRQLAVYFVVFEAELVFLYPWSASLLPGSLLGSALGYYGVVPFLACLVVGFALEIQRDALKL